MNDNNLTNINQNKQTYRATRNLNTEIENPEININSITDINIKEISDNNIPNHNAIDNNFDKELDNNTINNEINEIVDNNSYSNKEINSTEFNDIPEHKKNNQFLKSFIKKEQTIPNYNKDTDIIYDKSKEKIHYEPTLKEKKVEPEKIKVPSEVGVMILVVIILLIVVIVIPYIYEFIQDIRLNLTR